MVDYFKKSSSQLMGSDAVKIFMDFFLSSTSMSSKTSKRSFCFLCSTYTHMLVTGGSVILAAVKTPDNKFARIIKPGRNMPAVKTPDKKFA